MRKVLYMEHGGEEKDYLCGLYKVIPFDETTVPSIGRKRISV